ncbi:MAG TPA: iron-containing alcohol dehydrogenase [Pirellulaceae bacterium]|nr:iron-containing alcohol dehydrogenase [Pirellulaceae bacterium]HMO93166.1 iron-containing alcohol dehydrogenase [Pirellulaceae bacterium]HMP70005.1 iron-containing alcohol dehydrogenase [Pirellulaceae bacterium]
MQTRIVFGSDSIERLGELASELGVSRVLMVSDPGIVQAGHVERGIESLRRAGLEVALFAEANENPTTRDVTKGMEVANDFKPDCLVGLGGGSAMDCAKGINFIFSCGKEMRDYWGIGKATNPMLPMIGVPTTAGTGSEMQSFALISDEHTHVKMACGDKRASCRIAILDPKLTLTQPKDVTALSGVDALSHALETYVTRSRNAISMHYSREAWRLLSLNFAKVLDNPNDLEARAGMQLGAAFSGVAIENSMLGASHALANPLTATYGTSHGQAVGVMLPHVIRFNGVQCEEWYRSLLEATRATNGAPPPEGGSDALSDYVKSLVAAAGLNTDLRGCGIEREKLVDLSFSAAEQWTGKFNPREVDQPTLLQLYEQAY